MFIKDKYSQESLIHICQGLNEKKMRAKALEIRLHDIHFYTFVFDQKGKIALESIKFCPYCGVDLEKDAFEE